MRRLMEEEERLRELREGEREIEGTDGGEERLRELRKGEREIKGTDGRGRKIEGTEGGGEERV